MIATDEEAREAYLEAFVPAYCEAMLWANTRQETEDGEGQEVEPAWWQEPRSGWQLRAFDADAQAAILSDCEAFVTAQWADLADLDPAQCGHDFALSRNGHGAGFFDRGYGERGDRLQDAARIYGASDGYLTADESEVHLS